MRPDANGVFFSFQSTFPQGERLVSSCIYLSHFPFQSTFPQGERHEVMVQLRESMDFNPRSHKGNDKNMIKKIIEDRISIHVPTRGTTLSMTMTGTRKAISIHVPTRGTTKCLFATDTLCVFQSTFPQGERPIALNALM